VPVENAAHIANLVPNHTLRLIPGAEHTFKEKKEEVTQAVIDWLQSQAKASRSLRLDRAYRHISLSRFVMLQGVTNCRDVGGYPTLDGGIVRPRKFFRSGEMTGATAKDVQLLTSLDIHTIFDLRSDPEIQSRGVVDLKCRQLFDSHLFIYLFMLQGSDRPKVRPLSRVQGRRLLARSSRPAMAVLHPGSARLLQW